MTQTKMSNLKPEKLKISLKSWERNEAIKSRSKDQVQYWTDTESKGKHPNPKERPLSDATTAKTFFPQKKQSNQALMNYQH